MRIAAYQADGFLSDGSAYAAALRTLGMDGTGEILAAVDGGRLLGTVMLLSWPHGGEVVRAPGEAEVRALAVSRYARGRGVGRALLTAVTPAGHGAQRARVAAAHAAEYACGPASVHCSRLLPPARPRLPAGTRGDVTRVRPESEAPRKPKLTADRRPLSDSRP